MKTKWLIMNAIPISNTHYFWILPDENLVEELESAVSRLGQATLLVGFNTYTQIRHHYQDQLSWRDTPDVDCLDMFILRTSQGKINIAVTR